jgi:hypothetical protein
MISFTAQIAAGDVRTCIYSPDNPPHPQRLQPPGLCLTQVVVDFITYADVIFSSIRFVVDSIWNLGAVGTLSRTFLWLYFLRARWLQSHPSMVGAGELGWDGVGPCYQHTAQPRAKQHHLLRPPSEILYRPCQSMIDGSTTHNSSWPVTSKDHYVSFTQYAPGEWPTTTVSPFSHSHFSLFMREENDPTCICIMRHPATETQDLPLRLSRLI